MNRLALIGTCCAVLATTAVSAAQETTGAAGEPTPTVDPTIPRPSMQFDFGLRGVTSLNGMKSYDSSSPAGLIDFSDTYAYARGRTPLLKGGGRVGTVVAITFPDVYNVPGTLFLAEANAFYEDRWVNIRIGRGRIRSFVVPMPTLRDDDLLRYTDIQNPFSNGLSTSDHQFGNTADVTIWPTPRAFVDAHLENMPSSLGPASVSDFVVNSSGLSIGYRQIPALVPLTFVRKLGVGGNVYSVNEAGQRFAWNLVAGSWLNLVPDPVHNIDWRLQGIYGNGTPGLSTLATVSETFRTRQVSAVSALGYTYRRELLPTFRTNLIGAYKRYLDAQATQWSVAANAFYSLSTATEIGVQYQFRARAAVPEAFGDNFAHSVKLAFIVAVDTTSGPTFDSRDSPLNTESGYLP